MLSITITRHDLLINSSLQSTQFMTLNDQKRPKFEIMTLNALYLLRGTWKLPETRSKRAKHSKSDFRKSWFMYRACFEFKLAEKSENRVLANIIASKSVWKSIGMHFWQNDTYLSDSVRKNTLRDRNLDF